MTSPVSWNSTSTHAQVDLVNNMQSLLCFIFSSSIVNQLNRRAKYDKKMFLCHNSKTAAIKHCFAKRKESHLLGYAQPPVQKKIWKNSAFNNFPWVVWLFVSKASLSPSCLQSYPKVATDLIVCKQDRLSPSCLQAVPKLSQTCHGVLLSDPSPIIVYSCHSLTD